MTKIHGLELGIMAWCAVMFIGFVASTSIINRGLIASGYIGLKNSPWWAPPPWLFGVVWFVMYTLEAVAFTLVRLDGEWKSGVNLTACVVFLALLIAEFAWSIAFVYSLGASTIVVFISLALAIWDTWLFFNVPPLLTDDGDLSHNNIVAGWLLVPVDVWLLFAFILSAVLWARNPRLNMRDHCAKQRVAMMVPC